MKLKTRKAAKKRIIHKEGFLKRKNAFKSHLMLSKSAKASRRLCLSSKIHDADIKTYRRMFC